MCIFYASLLNVCAQALEKMPLVGFHPTRVTTPIAQSQTSHLTSPGHAQHASLISWPYIPSYVDLPFCRLFFNFVQGFSDNVTLI
jgi:hypothetical protein